MSTFSADNKWHIKLRISGSREKIDLFNWILRDTDIDWPWPSAVTQTNVKHAIGVCRVCHGVVYKNPRFDVKHIKALGKQICAMGDLPGRLKIRIDQYRKEEKCKEAVRNGLVKMGNAEEHKED